MSDAEPDTSETSSTATAMNVFRAVNPGMDEDTQRILENSLNETDNSLFTLLMTSDWEDNYPNEKAVEKFFKYIKAGRALVNSLTDSDTPTQQRAALKVLVRCLHKNLEIEINRIEETAY